jgi:hypothetical protein
VQWGRLSPRCTFPFKFCCGFVGSVKSLIVVNVAVFVVDSNCLLKSCVVCLGILSCGIVDGTESAKIYKLVVYGSINSDSVLYAGGITGQLINNAVVDGCGFVGDVCITTSNDEIVSAGGIVGIVIDGGYITNCYHNGNVSSTKNAGGILGTVNLTQTCSVKLENCYQTNGAIIGTEFAGAVVGDCIYTDSVSGDVNISNCYSTNDTGTNKSSQNATVDNTLILSKSLLKKAAEDLGAYFAENTNSDLNDGYPVYA